VVAAQAVGAQAAAQAVGAQAAAQAVGGTGGTVSFDGNGAAAAATPGAAASAAQRVAALDAVAAEVAAQASSGLRFDSTVLAQRLLALPAQQRVGVSERMQNVWALFTDGRALVVPNNLEPMAATGGAAPQPLSGGRARILSDRAVALASDRIPLPSLLVQPQYRQFDMFGDVPISAAVEAAHVCQDFVDGQTLPTLRLLARGRGFALPASQCVQPPDQGYGNGVDGLRDIGGDGIFFITARSAAIDATDFPQTVICTATAATPATPATEANELRYASDLSAGALTYAVALRGNGSNWVPQKVLAMTPAFVTLNRWRFPDECIGILNLTGGSVLPRWDSALRGAGLRNVFTWDKPGRWNTAATCRWSTAGAGRGRCRSRIGRSRCR